MAELMLDRAILVRYEQIHNVIGVARTFDTSIDRVRQVLSSAGIDPRQRRPARCDAPMMKIGVTVTPEDMLTLRSMGPNVSANVRALIAHHRDAAGDQAGDQAGNHGGKHD